MLAAVFLTLASTGIMLPPITCVLADHFPQIEAVITPPDSKARLFFKGAGSTAFYHDQALRPR